MFLPEGVLALAASGVATDGDADLVLGAKDGEADLGFVVTPEVE